MNRHVKTPPFLLLAGLLFWGWQSGFLLAGAVMGLALESARFLQTRWDLTAEDFRRIRNFCALLALAMFFYVFSTNQQEGGLNGLLHANTFAATRYVGVSATAFLRWLPMALFLFIAAQQFSEQELVPLAAVSWFLRRVGREGTGGERRVDLSYPYLMVCLFSAGIHLNEGTRTHYWGEAVLITWALWPLRSRRFAGVVWLATLAAAVALGFGAQSEIGALQRLLEGYNAQWIARLLRSHTEPSQSLTAIGHIGELSLSSRIVIRLETQSGRLPPVYLREASYRHYRSPQQIWNSGGVRDDFVAIRSDKLQDSSWTLLPGKTNGPVVTISSYLDGRSQETGDPEGLLPLPEGTGRLEKLPVFSLKTNRTAAVLASGLGLVIFDATYAPGLTLDAPPDASTNHQDLAVPTNEAPAFARIISELKIAGATDQQKLLAVAQFFSTKFVYSTWGGPEKIPGTNETALSRFLLHSRSGHCEYFATATVLLLRQMGIPARYAVGYYVHEKSGHGYVVRERDGHAWCIVWNAARQSWMDFDTTPATWVRTEAARAPAWQWLADAWSRIKYQIAKIRWGRTNLRQYLLWSLFPALGLLGYQIIFRRGRRRQKSAKTPATALILWPGLDSEFYLLETKLAARGIAREPGEPLSDWLARALADPALADLRRPLQDLLPLHYAHRFDPRGLGAPARQRLAHEAKTCLDRI